MKLKRLDYAKGFERSFHLGLRVRSRRVVAAFQICHRGFEIAVRNQLLTDREINFLDN